MGALTDILAAEGVNLSDLRGRLTTNPAQPWQARTLAGTTHAVIHHTGTDWQATAEGIARYHVTLKSANWPHGWPGIAYTFYLHQHDGEPRPVTDFCHGIMEWGPHCYKLNDVAFGVCLSGNYTNREPSDALIMELARLMRGLQRFYAEHVGFSLVVKPHNQIVATKCPGKVWGAYLAAIGAA